MELKKFKPQDKTMCEFKRRARQMSPHKGGQSPSEYYANDYPRIWWPTRKIRQTKFQG